MKISSSGFDAGFRGIENELKGVASTEEPVFARYTPAISFFKMALKPYMKYKNIVLIGHGGSITSTEGFWGALRNDKKNLFVIDTPEPDYIEEVKKKCQKNDTVAVVVSKSGTSVDILEIMMSFLGYEMIIVTNTEGGTLLRISEKFNLPLIEHPEIGGRFSAFTSSTLVPCYLLGIDIDELFAGALDMCKKCSPAVTINNNPALKIAAELYSADKKGYSEVFVPIYSKKLTGFSNLIIQLIHESSGKEGRGQTFYAASAPEAQHHTNQRFFGGRKNVVGFFIRTNQRIQKNDSKITIPEKLRDLYLRDGKLGDLDGNTYAQALEFESDGVKAHARRMKIPFIDLSFENCDEFELGGFVALWQYIGVYSSILRNVNPFDQPEVEFAKKISFERRISAAKNN